MNYISRISHIKKIVDPIFDMINKKVKNETTSSSIFTELKKVVF